MFDGQGRRVLARVESVGRERTVLAVLEREAPEASGLEVVLAQALVPAKKMDLILEKASEIGISEFVALETERSLRVSREWSGRKIERWARIAREATKQCKGTAVPIVRPPVRLKDWLGSAGDGQRIFLSERGGRPLRTILADAGTGAGASARVLVVVGPTGGWSATEEDSFRRAGFEAASLGRRILKSETAALAAVALVAHLRDG